MVARKRLTATGLLAVLVLAGCSKDRKMDYSELDLAPVSGTVKLDGKPLAGASIIFEGENKRFSYGKTDNSGQYSLNYDSNQKGVTAGKKTVRITMGSPEGSDGEDVGGENEDGSPKKTSTRIPAKYNRKSTLQREVKPGGAAQTFDFELTSG